MDEWVAFPPGPLYLSQQAGMVPSSIPHQNPIVLSLAFCLATTDFPPDVWILQDGLVESKNI